MRLKTRLALSAPEWQGPDGNDESPRRASQGLAWRLVVFTLLMAMGVALLASALQENQTWDEAIHLAAGYAYLQLGDFRWNPEHPPLGKLLSALPLLALDPEIPLTSEAWRSGDQVGMGVQFLYANSRDPDVMLLFGRLPTMALTLLLGLALALWSRRHFGAGAAAVAVFFFATDPNIIAHGRYITTDLIATLTVFLTVIAWTRFLERRRGRDLAFAGFALGLAFSSKFSTLTLLGLLPLLYLIHWWRGASRRDLVRSFLLAHAAAFSLAFLVVLAIYGPESLRAAAGQEPAGIEAYINRKHTAGRALAWAGETLGLPAHAYLKGLSAVAEHNANGHRAYLLGEVSEKGRWYFFPAAMAVKTPSALLAVLLAGAGLAFRRRAWMRTVNALRQAPFPWIAVAVTPAFLFTLSMASNLNLGLRHILPVYPFLFIWAGAILMRKPWWPALALALSFQVYENVQIYPHYLAFFNTFSGGPAAGPRYLLDSNIDWGQDAKKLGQYLNERGFEDVCIAYFGTTDLQRYGVHYRPVVAPEEWQAPEQLDCVAAMSVTLLHNVYGGPDLGLRLRELQPDAKIGYSIYVYDLRRKKGDPD